MKMKSMWILLSILIFTINGNASSTFKWITPTVSSCKSNGGEIDSNGFCSTFWENAKKICSTNSARLPTIEELEEEMRKCEGIVVKNQSNYIGLWNKNKANNHYQKCYKAKGFGSSYYWSFTTSENYSLGAWIVNFLNGLSSVSSKPNDYYVRCVR